MTASVPPAADLQALLLGHFLRPLSRHLLFRFDRPRGARAFLAALADGVVTMGDARAVPEAPLTSVGVSVHGLRALGLEDERLAGLDPRFLEGHAPRRMGDHPDTASAEANWWERRFETTSVHCVVGVHALSAEQREERTRVLLDLAAAHQVEELVPRRDGTRLDGSFPFGPRRLHFGYVDGISGPRIAWRPTPGAGEVDFREFVLGYAGRPDEPAFVRGSSYGVFRWIYQDVARFNRFLREEGPRLFPELEPEAAEELLAAKLMGRWRDGTPLALSPDRPDAELALRDDFDFAELDPDGKRCPFSAHIRVMNPRGQGLKPAVGAVPVVVRRGTPYGPPLEGMQDDGQDRGLVGVFLCADINRQVLTLTAWARENNFSPVFRTTPRAQDALIGNRMTKDPSFTVPGAGVIETLPSFVTTKGTALLLYPGRETLDALAAGAPT